jgi:hypothetical protein
MDSILRELKFHDDMPCGQPALPCGRPTPGQPIGYLEFLVTIWGVWTIPFLLFGVFNYY